MKAIIRQIPSDNMWHASATRASELYMYPAVISTMQKLNQLSVGGSYESSQTYSKTMVSIISIFHSLLEHLQVEVFSLFSRFVSVSSISFWMCNFQFKSALISRNWVKSGPIKDHLTVNHINEWVIKCVTSKIKMTFGGGTDLTFSLTSSFVGSSLLFSSKSSFSRLFFITWDYWISI